MNYLEVAVVLEAYKVVVMAVGRMLKQLTPTSRTGTVLLTVIFYTLINIQKKYIIIKLVKPVSVAGKDQ
jgi:hypothetical protein